MDPLQLSSKLSVAVFLLVFIASFLVIPVPTIAARAFSFAATAACSSNVLSLGSEARALLHWKTTLQIGNLSTLSSSTPYTKPCMWFGIKSEGGRGGGSTVTEINLPRAVLAGNLDSFDFSSLLSLTCHHLRHNYLNDTFHQALAHLPILPHSIWPTTE